MKPLLTWPIEKVVEASHNATTQMIERLKPKDLTPMFLGIRADGQEIVIAAPWRDEDQKYASVDTVRRIFAEQRVVAYAQTSEIWVSATAVAEATASGGKLTKRVSEYADAEERAMILASNGLKSCVRTYFIDRDADGRITGLRLEQEVNDAGVTGRMADLLPHQGVSAGSA